MLVHHVVSLHGAFKNKNPNMQAYKYIWKGNMVVWSVFVKNTNIMSSYNPLDYTRMKFWMGPKPFSLYGKFSWPNSSWIIKRRTIFLAENNVGSFDVHKRAYFATHKRTEICIVLFYSYKSLQCKANVLIFFLQVISIFLFCAYLLRAENCIHPAMSISEVW